MIERRTILWKKEVDKAIIKEKQRLKELEQIKGKGKSKKYVRGKICSKYCFYWNCYDKICLRDIEMLGNKNN